MGVMLRPLTPTVINFFGFWLLELSLAWPLAVVLHFLAEGAFLALVIAKCSMAAAGNLLFRQGRWKKQQIYGDPRPTESIQIYCGEEWRPYSITGKNTSKVVPLFPGRSELRNRIVP